MNIFVKRLKAVARTLPGDIPLERILRLVILAVFVGVVVYYAIGRKQSFTLYATTNSVAVNVTGDDPQDWELADASLCLRKSEDVTSKPETLAPNPQCSPSFFVNAVEPPPEAEDTAAKPPAVPEQAFFELTWVEGTRLVINHTAGGPMTVEVTYEKPELKNFSTFDGIPITQNSVLFFPRSSLATTEAVFIKGRVQVGNPVKSRTSFLLLNGSYEIRERLGLSSGPTLIAKGTLLPGDFVSLVDRQGAEIPTQMVLMPPARTSDRGFDIVATSPLRHSALLVDRIGAARTEITTRWMDRLASDALPLALSIFLGLLGASLGIAKSLVGPAPQSNAPKQSPSDKAPL